MTATPLSPLQKAFLALQDAEARVAELESARAAPIAVIGLGCRAPGGVVDGDSFWRLLDEGRDATGPVPADRWNHEALFDPDPETPGRIATRNGGFLDRVDAFDPEFFGVTPREAAGMDPQQRLVLEVCWEALENAGQSPRALEGSSTGVFIGAAASDYAYLQLLAGDPSLLDAHFASGMAHSVLSGRVSYLLGLQGPALTIDTACSSSLVAIHTACQSLRAGGCRMALAGGVNLILAPDIFIALSRARMLAPDGRCKTFDAAADGFARGEGCAIVALKRLSDAQADGDRVLAVIRGAAVNQDGPSSGLTAPNGPAQEAVIRAALADANLTPGQVGYIEAHGTGTELGDPLEARALGAVFAKGRQQPLLIGSVKTNIGHLEGAAGAIGLVKTILSMRHGKVPAHLHLRKPSEHIAWDDLNLTVSPRATPFPEIAGRRIAGVSSFGFSGTNAHIIVEAAPARPETAAPDRAWALPVSAPDAARLSALAGDLRDAIGPETRLADVARTLAVGRAHLAERAVVRADTAPSAKAALDAVARGEDAPGVARARVEARDPPRIAFLFTGQGSQFTGMGKALYEASPAYRAAFDQCDAGLTPLLGRSIKDVVFDPASAELLDQTGFAQPALFALEYALAAFWRSLGVEPVAALGHSVGEYVAACVGGAISLHDALKLIAARARLMQSLPAGGAMAAVFAPEARVAPVLAPFAGEVSLAAVNGPAQVVISGAADAVAKVCAALSAAGMKTHPLQVSHAFHSPLMDPILGAFEAEAGAVTFRAPGLQLISNLTGRPATLAEISAPAYWRDHLRSTVRFADGLAALRAAKVDLCLEIGPRPTLTGFAAAVFDDEDAPALVSSLRKDGDGWSHVLDAVAQLHLAGVDLDWAALDPERLGAPIDLPLSPFKRERHWFKAGAPRRAVTGTGDPLLGARQRSAAAQAVWEAHSLDAPSWIEDHRVLDQVIAPGAMLIEMMRLAAGAAALEDIELQDALAFDAETPRLIQTVCEQEDGGRRAFVASLEADAEDAAPWRRHAAAVVSSDMRATDPIDLAAARAACPEAMDVADYYAAFEPRGYAFGPAFHTLTALWRGEGAALAEVQVAPALAADLASGTLHPLLLDGCLQAAGAAMPAEAASQALLPVAIARYHVISPLQGRATVHARVSPAADGYRADIVIFDEAGAPAAELAGVRFIRATRAALAERAASALERSLYDVAWRETPAAAEVVAGLPVQALAEKAETRGQALAPTVGLADYDRVLGQVEALAAPIIVRALAQLGWHPQAGDRVEAAALAGDLGVAPQHHRLFGRLLVILGEMGRLTPDGDGWRLNAPLADEDPDAALADLARSAPAGADAMVAMVARVAAGLSQALTGAREPMDLLFPAGATGEAERMYRDSAPAALFNGMLAEAVAQAVGQREGAGRFEILEIGAGTGGTTTRLLDRLPAGNLGYLYTDIGATFVAKAQERFGADPRMAFATFDLEREFEPQGLEAGRYDLIVAANVIHATADLRDSLARIRRLLKPGGLLAMMEVAGPQRWFDLTVGLTSGWWAFTDLDLRPDYPTLPPDGWRALLEASGFDVAVAQPKGLGPAGLRDALILARARPEAWAVLAGDDFADTLADEIAARGGRAVRIDATGDPRDLCAALQDQGFGGLVVAPAAADPAVAALDLVRLASALAEQPRPPRLAILTRGAQDVDGAVVPGQAPLWGVARSLTLEAPELRAVVIDLDPSRPPGEAAAVAAELSALADETQVALRDGGRRRVARLARRGFPQPPARDAGPWRLQPAVRGSYDAFDRAPLARRAPGPGEVEIETLAWGLNFKDVLNSLDLYPGDPGPLGGECAGRVVAVGQGVTRLQVGDEVLAVAGGSFASHVVAPAAMVQPKPADMSFEEAAAFPIPWLTAAFCLEHLAKVRPGERVLIHAAAGGVGLAAVRLAQRAGAEVFATAGSPWKRDLLAAAGVAHVYDSRSPAFADQLLADTNGEGVQVVLNSLAGEMMDASFRVVAPRGRFIEIGKNGLKDQAWVEALGKDIAYEIVDWGETAARDPELIGGLLADLVGATGDLAPLPRSAFPVDRAATAFRLMAQARHAGKVVLRRGAPTSRIRRDGTYLVTGGLGGIGLETARWLAARGAGRLVLFGRRAPGPEARDAIAEMRACGAEVWAETLDVADREALAALLQRIRADGPPLRGVIHSAGALDNAALANQDKARFDAVFRAKCEGATALDALTRLDPLDIFVLYSSVASVLGAAGQVNHAAANAYMDALAHERRSLGLPALSINWGAWSGVGAAADATERLSAQGISTFTPAQGIAALERLLAGEEAQAVVATIDWPSYLAHRGAPSPFFSEIAAAAQARPVAAQATEASGAARAEIEAAPVERRPALIAALVTRVAAGVVGFAADRQIDPRTPLGELGLDSLMAVDLRNKLGKALGHRFPSTLLFDHPTIGALSDLIGLEVFGLVSAEPPKAPPPAVKDDAGALLDAIEGLDDEALDRLLAAQLGMNA